MDITRKSDSDYLANYDSGWRLPEYKENALFVSPSASPDWYYEAGTDYYQQNPSPWSGSDASRSGIFPANTARDEDPRLPPAGARYYTDGSASWRGTYGWYLSSTPTMSLGFNSTGVSAGGGFSSYAVGMAVRCVRD
jgi:hypothetical protein